MAAEKVSIIVPAHNEARILRRNVLLIERMLTGIAPDFEIIISEDGSTDGTAQIARSLARKGRIRSINFPKRQGKGTAIMRAVEHSAGDIILFMDADLASDPSHVRGIVGHIRDGASIVIGSRYLERSRSKRNPVRLVASKGYNFLVRALLGSRLSDHQCGFKAFRKSKLLPVIREVRNERWFWDTELLVRAQRRGLVVKEMPIAWREAEDSKFNLLGDTWHMAASLARFKLREG